MVKIKKGIKIFFFIVLGYLLYSLILGTLIFKTTKVKATDLSYDKNEILSVSTENLYATIIETHKEALDVRLRLIEQATETINISYYYIQSDVASELFFGALLNKADEGIKINIAVDGLVSKRTKVFKTITNHPNIKYYIYEPKSILLPFNNQNTLHDKLLIIDEKYGLIGGRNISDRFLIEAEAVKTYDRDVLIFSDDDTTSTVLEMKAYLHEVYESKFTKEVKLKKHKDHDDFTQTLIDNYKLYMHSSYDLDYFLNEKVKIDNATFVRSPLNRMNKTPVVGNTIFSLYEENLEMTIQSPYITQSRLLLSHFPSNGENKNITLITNNIITNPNIFGAAGYTSIKKDLARNYRLYEFQNDNSIHAKTITIGDDISVIGSFNMDHRSFFLSTESVVIIYSKDFQDKLNTYLDDIIDQSLKVDEKGKYISDDLVEPTKEKAVKKALIQVTSVVARLFKEMLMGVR